MLVQVDESRGNHEALRIEYLRALERLRRNPRDLAVGDPDIADCVGAGLRVHDAAAFEHYVVRVGDGGQRRREARQQEK